MNRKSILTALVTMTALVQFAGLAAAASFPYAVLIGMEEDYVVSGANPTLSQATGSAEISAVADLGAGLKRVTVHCFDNSPATCTGDIVTT